jgi:hypothetical protein
MTTLTLNKLDVARAAAKAYREGRLSAQGSTPKCRYRDPSGLPCAVGAAIDDETAHEWDVCGGNTVTELIDRGKLRTDDKDALRSIQAAHDDWASGDEGGERQLVTALNNVLPPEERIDEALASCGEG